MSDRPTITCPRCRMTSAHPRDLDNGYCGNCHDFTSDPNVAKLKARLAEQGVASEWGDERGGWLKIEHPDVLATVERRPPHCDRGRWIVKMFPKGYRVHIDAQDGFPRYYFGDEALATEVHAWMSRRGLL